jgi:hypothetical protein
VTLDKQEDAWPSTAPRTLRPAVLGLVGLSEGGLSHVGGDDSPIPGERLRLPISHGQVVKTVQKVSAALGPCYEQLQQALPRQASMGLDETGYPERARRLWRRRDETPDQRWEKAAAKALQELLAVARRAPRRSEAKNLAKRSHDRADAYFTFLDKPGTGVQTEASRHDTIPMAASAGGSVQ